MKALALAALLASPAFAGPAETRFAALEAALDGSKRICVDFTSKAQGTIDADITGSLVIAPSGVVTLRFTGSGKGGPIDVTLSSDGAVVTIANAVTGKTTSSPAPSKLGEALGHGLLRTGLLHDLGLLAAGQMLDGGEGGTAADFPIEQLSLENGAAGLETLVFKVAPASFPIDARARLELDANGMPARRTQSMRWQGGSMEVVETYRFGCAP